MRPLAGPRSLSGPTIVLNGSLPKLLLRNSSMSCVPGVSAAIASCTASFTSAPFMPTSSAFFCCQSKRSGKYAACACAPNAPFGFVGDTIRFCARAGAMIAAARNNGSARFSMTALLAMLQYSAHETMGSRFRAASVFALSLGAAAPAAASPQPDRVPLDVVLDRAGGYLDYFVDEVENGV